MDDLHEVRVRALKVPDPQFYIDRLKAGKEALMLSGAGHTALEGEEFILVNERLTDDEPTFAFGRVTFTQQADTIDKVAELGSRQSSVDTIMRREFATRKPPFHVLKFKLVKAFGTPRRLRMAPAGRFSSFIDFNETWEISEQKRPSLKAQTYILSKERFKTQGEANKWMDDNDVPRPKVDEKEESFRYRQFSPDRCQEGSERTTRITDGVQIVGCRLKPEFREQAELPKSKLGLNTAEALEAAEKEPGGKFSQEKSNFKQKAPSADKVCGVCRFYLRDDTSLIGKCQVVAGDIPWFSTTDLFISAEDEAEAAFGKAEESKESIAESSQEPAGDGRGDYARKATLKEIKATDKLSTPSKDRILRRIWRENSMAWLTAGRRIESYPGAMTFSRLLRSDRIIFRPNGVSKAQSSGKSGPAILFLRSGKTEQTATSELVK